MRTKFLKFTIRGLLLLAFMGSAAAAEGGLKGDEDAIERAKSMVGTMGGMDVWSKLGSVHFVHEWDLANRAERYMEEEILDLTGARSYVTMESESYNRTRAYSPEHRYWSLEDGVFRYGSDGSLERAVARAPYSIYRLARSIGRNDPSLTITTSKLPSEPRITALEFTYEGGEAGGWIVLNARDEPVVWETTQYTYDFGPLARFGNLYVPDWATTSHGLVRYQMVSLEGRSEKPELNLFAPPEGISASQES